MFGYRWVTVLLTLLAASAVFATTPPTHSTLLYSSSLDSGNDPAIGTLNNRDGQFITGSGWKATGSNSQLMITLPDGLPLEGTFSVKVTNFNPATQNISSKQQIINLYSQANGSKDIFDTHGSWVNIRTGTGYTDGSGGYGYKMLAAYDSRRDEDRYMHDATWRLNRTYEFTIVWDEYHIWTIVDGVVQGELPMTGTPVERFRYIFLGTDNVYVAQPGPIYKDLRIFSADNPSDAVLSFTDITSQSGTEGFVNYWYAHSANFSDVNKDGFYDLFTSHAGGNKKTDILFRNNGNNTFSNVTEASNIQDMGNTHGVVTGDIDNDGDLDVFMTNQPTVDENGRNRLYQNNGNGYFTDISDQAGLSDLPYFSRGGVIADFNNDGWQDIFVVNWGDKNELYLNDGNGHFTHVHRGTDGPDGDEEGRQGVTVGDVDNDGDVDIYVCRRDAINWLFINDGNANFTQESAARNVDGSASIRSHGATFVDIDNDADLDLFVMNYAQPGASVLPQVYAFINDGNGYFTDKTSQYNIKTSGYSILFGDLDNDTDQDMYLVRNDEKEDDAVPQIYTNNGSGDLIARRIPGAGAATDSEDQQRGAALGDIDNDGDLDAYVACVTSRNFLLRNDLESDNHYLDVLCIGPGGDYGGFGSKVSVYEAGYLGDVDHLLGYQEAVSGVSYMGQNQTAVHFGLAEHQQVDVRVVFTNGEVADYNGVSADQVLEVTANPPIPTTMERISDASLEATAGNMVDGGVIVKIVDENGRGIANHPVTYTVTGGGGTLNGSSRTQVDTTTNGSGTARIDWYVGTAANVVNTLSVESDNEGSPLLNSPMNFTALVTPAPDTLLTIHDGNLQNAVPGTTLPDSIKVLVHDSYTNPHANAWVNFQVISGNGNIDGSSSKQVQTNASGIAAVQWTLGNVVGENAHSLKASLVSAPQTSVTFTASTSTAPIDTLLYVSGNGQSAPATQALAAPFVVQIKDSLGNVRGGFDINFKVMAGGGNLAGATERIVTTDITGKASATLTLGQSAGTDNNIVQATYSGLDDIITFTASATAGAAVSMQKNGGDNQTAGVGQETTLPLSVRVRDAFTNPVAGHAVTFTVNNNKGRVNDKLTDTVVSDADGIAQVSYKVGNEPGAYSVTVTSSQGQTPLTGSPLIFNATATSQPAKLVKVSGDSTTGIANQPLTLPLQVKVADANGYAVSNYPVTFVSESGGGTFEGNLQIQQTTNAQGIASVYPTLGNRVGTHIYVFSAKAYGNNGQHLQDSPVTFYISAKSTLAEKLSLVSGNLQSGQAGEFLASPIQVIVQDPDNNPVANHSVQFSVIEGGGKLGAGQTTTATIKSGANGVAKINFKLGNTLGDSAHVVEITSTDGIEPLQNSPIRIYAHAAYGQVDPANSSLIISDSSIPADGSSELLVSAQLRDQSNQPVPGEQVVFNITGSGNTVTQPADVTDSNGMASCRITSTKAENKTVTVSIANKSITLDAQEIISFTPGPAQQIQIVSGNNQTGTINSVLPQDLMVSVQDAMGNPVKNHNVTFQIVTGGGSIQPQQTLASDSAGQAHVNWVLGPLVGVQQASASAAGVAGSVQFSATGQMPGMAYINKAKGDGQFASPSATFTDSLTVRIVDANGNPISGIPVHFRIDQGDATLSGISNVNSNSFGYAATQLIAGQLLGTVKVNASINDQQSVNFICTVSSSLPDTMYHVFGNGSQGTVGSEVFPLTVQVMDNNDNPISGVPITFTSQNPTGSIVDELPIFTVSNGQASARIKLGTVAGEYRFTASHSSLKGSPIHFDLVALPDNASDIEIVSGNDQSGNPLEVLAEPVVIKIVDQYGNGIPNIQVQFDITAGNGEVQTSQPIVTDATGTASASWKLGASGQQSLRVSSAALPNESVTINAQLLANGAPVVTAVSDTSIQENQTLVFQVQAIDPEGTDVTLSVSNLPAGAEFDGQETGQFTWTPGYNDQGNHMVTFTARDANGTTTDHPVTIHVINVNRKPVVQSSVPEQNSVSAEFNKLTAFKVHAMDADQDPLQYRWYVNGNYIRSQNDADSIIIQPNETWPQQFDVLVLITDTIDTTKHKWTINMLPTAVELISFAAMTEKDEVTLTWSTRNENNTAGYNILCSDNPNGPFTAVNSELITPQPGMDYEYLDKPDKRNLVYYYQLQEVEYSGASQTFDPVRVQIALPTENRLLQNYPNPFNPVTTIEYELAKPQHIEVHIFNLQGQLITTLYTGEQKAGYHQMIWDSKNAQGVPVASGIYYCMMTGTGYRNTIKLLLLK